MSNDFDADYVIIQLVQIITEIVVYAVIYKREPKAHHYHRIPDPFTLALHFNRRTDDNRGDSLSASSPVHCSQRSDAS